MSPENKPTLPTQPSLGPMPEYSSDTAVFPWVAVSCYIGAALCSFIATYRAFHHESGSGWGLAAFALTLLALRKRS